MSPEYQATDGASWLDVALGCTCLVCSGTTLLTWMTWRLSPRILDIWTFPWMVTGCHSWWQKFVSIECRQSELPRVEFMDMQKGLYFTMDGLDPQIGSPVATASFRAVHWGYLWSKDALVWELQRILKANGNGKQDPTAIQVSDICRTSAQTLLTSLTTSLNTGNLPIGYPCPNLRLVINFADLKAYYCGYVCEVSKWFMLSTDLWRKNPEGPETLRFQNSEHPVVMQLPQDKETGMPPQTAEKLRAMAATAFLSPSTQRLQSWRKMIGTFPKGIKLYNPWVGSYRPSFVFLVGRRFWLFANVKFGKRWKLSQGDEGRAILGGC